VSYDVENLSSRKRIEEEDEFKLEPFSCIISSSNPKAMNFSTLIDDSENNVAHSGCNVL